MLEKVHGLAPTIFDKKNWRDLSNFITRKLATWISYLIRQSKLRLSLTYIALTIFFQSFSSAHISFKQFWRQIWIVLDFFTKGKFCQMETSRPRIPTHPLRHTWPEVVMENHTRSSAVHGTSHTLLACQFLASNMWSTTYFPISCRGLVTKIALLQYSTEDMLLKLKNLNTPYEDMY